MLTGFQIVDLGFLSRCLALPSFALLAVLVALNERVLTKNYGEHVERNVGQLCRVPDDLP